jgi:hypothetical protein
MVCLHKQLFLVSKNWINPIFVVDCIHDRRRLHDTGITVRANTPLRPFYTKHEFWRTTSRDKIRIDPNFCHTMSKNVGNPFL